MEYLIDSVEYRFFEGQLTPAYRYNFEPYVFNLEAYRILQAKGNWLSFFILNDRDNLVEAHVHFHCGQHAQSIVKAPFGGFEFSDALDPRILFDFIQFVVSRLKEEGMDSVQIVNPPLLYNPDKLALTETFLLNLGFEITRSDISSVIEVSDKPFSKIIHSRKKRKLSQTLPFQFDFRELSHDALEQVFVFIIGHRQKKRYQLSVTVDHLRNSIEALPDYYQLFGVFHKDEMIAASVAVRVSDHILYHFISDHVRKIEDARPALVLMQGIYEYCRRSKITLLDLGTSMTDDSPNFKLIRFKTEIGGQSTHKFTFYKSLR